MDPLSPSRAALLVANMSPSDLLDHLGVALARQGYQPLSGPPPSWHRAHDLEWVAMGAYRMANGPLTIGVPYAVQNIFQLATWLSAALETTPLVAWRRFMGQGGVAKFYRGAPRWRDGDDDDPELAWHLPASSPVDGFIPEDHGLPGDQVASERLLADTLEAFNGIGTCRWWALRSSDLHGL